LFGASQGEYPRAIFAPVDAVDCYYSVIEAFNIAEKYQCPVLIASDLLLSEHRETADPEAFTFDVPIDRGELITDGTPPDYNAPKSADLKGTVNSSPRPTRAKQMPAELSQRA
jgi:pyruvate/2-oxoacid:ferredoxin oxidoreductase alpha subunit